MQQLPFETILLVSQIDELKGRWSAGNNLSPQFLSNLKRTTLITSTGASTRIEGAQMDDEQIERYLGGLKVQKFFERDSQEVRGYYETLEIIFDNYQEIDLSENAVKQLHTQLLQYCTKDEWHRGNYKQLDNKVELRDPGGKALAKVFETTPAYLTAKEMKGLLDWHVRAEHELKHHPPFASGEFHSLLFENPPVYRRQWPPLQITDQPFATTAWLRIRSFRFSRRISRNHQGGLLSGSP